MGSLNDWRSLPREKGAGPRPKRGTPATHHYSVRLSETQYSALGEPDGARLRALALSCPAPANGPQWRRAMAAGGGMHARLDVWLTDGERAAMVERFGRVDGPTIRCAALYAAKNESRNK